MTFTLSALAIIALSWLIQLISVWQGRRGLRETFVLLYGIGAALMVVGTAEQGFTPESWLHLTILLIVALMYLKVHK